MVFTVVNMNISLSADAYETLAAAMERNGFDDLTVRHGVEIYLDTLVSELTSGERS